MGADVRALWIVGTPFSGSTIAQWLVGRFSKVFVAGEIDRIRAFNMHPHLEHDPKCYLTSCAFCKAHDLECPVWTAAMFEELARSGPSPRIYEALARVTGKDVILDSSKTPWWYLNVARHPDFREWKGRIAAIHAVRNPFAFAVSFANRTGQSLEQCVLAWVIINRDALEVVNRSGHFMPVMTLYHNRVLADPEGVSLTLSRWMDLGEGRGNAEHHFLGGNVAAFSFRVKEEQTTPHFDASIEYFSKVDAVADDDGRWRSRIDMDMRWRLSSLPGVREMCRQLGIDIDGLIVS